MKILFINTFDTYGGATASCRRVFQAIDQHTDLEMKLLVHRQTESHPQVKSIQPGWWGQKYAFLQFVMERLMLWPKLRERAQRFAFSPANIGNDIRQHPWVQAADILHLHWINFGFLSNRSLEQLTHLGKPIVWTLHDMWAFTGGCHYVGNCQSYQKHCGYCPFLKGEREKDLAYRVFEQKRQVFESKHFHFITSSEWLADCLRASALARHLPVQAIPTPIDTKLFHKKKRESARAALKISNHKFLMLFGSMNTSDPRKGFIYLQEALDFLKNTHPEALNSLELLVFGKSDAEILESLPFPVHDLGFLDSKTDLVNAYNAAHLFVLPSLEDNLPNTIIEALACGCPTVAFRSGGIPEMIQHQQTGYLAEARSAQDLAQGMAWLWQLHEQNPVQYQTIEQQAQQQAQAQFSEPAIARQYLALYQQLASR